MTVQKTPSDALPRYKQRRWLITAGLVGVAFFAFAFSRGVIGAVNDYYWHYQLGMFVCEGDPYHLSDWPRGEHYPFGRHLFNAALVGSGRAGAACIRLLWHNAPWSDHAMAHRFSRLIFFTVTTVGFCLAMALWHRMANRTRPLDRYLAFFATIFTCLTVYPYFLRDLDDAGLQTLLLILLTATAYALMTRHRVTAGALLAAAISYKATPLLLWCLLLYKRRWAEAAWTIVFLVLFNLMLPLLIFGPTRTLAGWQTFTHAVTAAIQEPDPCLNSIEPPRHQNQSLRMMIARYTQTYRPTDPPPRNDLYLPADPDQPAGPTRFGFIQFLDLSKQTARFTFIAVGLLIAALLAWTMRRPWTDDPQSTRQLPAQWAAAMIFCAILAPLCWLQHLVLIIPALLLVVRAAMIRQLRRWQWCLLACIPIITLILQRDVVGRELSILVLSYKLDTLVALMTVLLVLTLPDRTTRSSSNG